MFNAVGQALGAVFKKLADFFDLLDLSFFVAGAACLGALVYLLRITGYDIVPLEFDTSTMLATFLIVYILGLGCFAVGRVVRDPLVKLIPSVRKRRTHSYAEHVRHLVADHDLLEDPIIKPYLGDDRATGRLVARMWAEIRERPLQKESYAVISKFWVLRATYDGVAFASILWAGVVLVGLDKDTGSVMSWPVITVVAVGALLVALACLRESDNIGRNQLEELVATMAHIARLREEVPVVPVVTPGVVPGAAHVKPQVPVANPAPVSASDIGE